jgi:Ca2+-binding RTX toxin-like protein
VDSGTKYFGFSIKLDKDWIPAKRGAVWQLHGPANSPPGFSFQATDEFSIKVNGGTTNLDKQTNIDLSDGSLNKGQWVDWIVKITFSTTDDGEIEIWRHDEGESGFKQVLSVNAAVIQAPDGVPMDMTHKHGLYRNPVEHTQVLWLDNWTRADTYDEVKGVFMLGDGSETPDNSETPGGSETPDNSETPGDDETPDGSETPDDSETPESPPIRVGSEEAEKMVGTDGDDHVCGFDGNDTLKGNAGNDTIDGGAGADIINGNAGADVFVLRPGEGRDIINDFEDGVDVFSLEGGLSFEQLTFVDVKDATLIKMGDEVLVKAKGISAKQLTRADFTQGSEPPASDDPDPDPDTVPDPDPDPDPDPVPDIAQATYGTNASEGILGNNGDDHLFGLAGNDTLKGNGGDDILDGGAGADIINGGAGADTFVIRPGEGRDVINDFEDGIDHFWLDDGLRFDQLTFVDVSGATLIKKDGEVLVKVKGVTAKQLTKADFDHGAPLPSENETSSDPTAPANPKRSVIDGTGGDDGLLGDNGDNYLIGRDGNDTLKGNGGDDIIDGGAGSDIVNGNDGADVFVLRPGEGRDVINDFEDGIDAFLLLGGLTFKQLTFTRVIGATLIKYDGDVLAKVKGVDQKDLSAADFYHDTDGHPLSDFYIDGDADILL